MKMAWWWRHASAQSRPASQSRTLGKGSWQESWNVFRR